MQNMVSGGAVQESVPGAGSDSVWPQKVVSQIVKCSQRAPDGRRLVKKQFQKVCGEAQCARMMSKCNSSCHHFNMPLT
jgi:hypothetical protein